MTDYTTPPPPPPPPPPPGPPPGGPMASGKDNSQLMGIIGAVVGFLCCWPVGVGLGIYSLVQARKFGSSPMWGYIAIGASVLGIIINILFVVPNLTNN